MISFLVIFGCFIVSSFGQEATTCPENEEMIPCEKAICAEKSCSDIGKPLLCVATESCTPACSCISEYLRADNGTCIPRDRCNDITCPENEVVNPCSNTLCEEKTCSHSGNPIRCVLLESCRKTCSCTAGYLRADNGTCVLSDQCPTITCPEDEEVNRCANSLCREETCRDRERPIVCAFVDSCTPACSCKSGSLRADNGICIPRDQCPEILPAPLHH